MENQSNPTNVSDCNIPQLPLPVEVHNQVQFYLDPLSYPYYRGNFNIAESNGRIFLPPFPPGHTFMVTSSLLKMLIARGLFLELPSEDSCAHIDKLRSSCKSCLGRLDLNLNVIGL